MLCMNFSHMGLMQIEVYCISQEATTFVPTCTLYDGSPMTPALLHPHMGDLLMALLWVATKKYLWDTWTMTTREKILMRSHRPAVYLISIKAKQQREERQDP